MSKIVKQHKKLNIEHLHPMDSFGVVSGITKEIRVTRLEKRLNPLVAFPHKHNFYHLVIVLSGSGWHEIDFKRYKVQEGAVFFMGPAQVHSWQMSTDTTGIVIEFVNQSLQSIDDQGLVSTALSSKQDSQLLSGALKENLFHLAKELLGEYEKLEDQFELVMRFKLSILILMLKRAQIKGVSAPTRSSKFKEDFLILLEKNYKKEHGPDFYSRKLNLTTKSLTEKVKRHFGKSLRGIIQERCLLESKRLLAYSDLSVSEIAQEVGFLDPNYFTRFFKLKTRQNPGKFRNSVRKIC